MSKSSKFIEQVRTALGLMVVTGIGYWPQFFLPFIIGGLIDGLGFTETQAGIVASTEFAVIAFVSHVAARFVDHPSMSSSMVRLGAGLAIAGNICSFFIGGYYPLLASRMLAGLGEGLSLAIGSASSVNVSSPDRFFSVVMIGRGLMGTVMIPVVTLIIENYSISGAFLFLAAIPLLVLPVAGWIPQRSSSTMSSKMDVEDPQVYGTALLANLLILSMLFASMAEAFWYAFIERKGIDAGIEAREIATFLAVCTVIGIGGALIPIAVGTRFGRFVPILLSFLLCILGGAVSLLTKQPMLYLVGGTIYTAFYALALPYCLGLSTEFSHSHAIATRMGAMLVGGYVVGPAIAGYTFDQGGFSALAGLFSGTCAIPFLAIAVIYFSIRHKKKERNTNNAAA